MAGERDLGGEAAPTFSGGHAVGCLASAAGHVEFGGDPGLFGSRGGLAAFELRDTVDQRRLIGEWVGDDARFEHMFDSTRKLRPR